VLTTETGAAQLLRTAHRERMRWAPWATAHGEGYAEEYEDAVVKRALDALARRAEPPFMHSHAVEEAGACEECDAAAILEVLEEGNVELLAQALREPR
jgi:hypothetical protein